MGWEREFKIGNGIVAFVGGDRIVVKVGAKEYLLYSED